MDEAIARLEKYLDDAMIAGHYFCSGLFTEKELAPYEKVSTSISGKLKFVKSYKLAEFGEGDAGVTIVTF